MEDTKGLLDSIKQHDKLTIKVSSTTNNHLPAPILRRLLEPHRTAYYFFVFVNKGTAIHRIDLQPVTVSTAQLLFVVPNQIHTPPPKPSGVDYFKLSCDERCLTLLPQSFPFLINPLRSQVISFDPPATKRVQAVFALLEQLLQPGTAQHDPVLILAYLNALFTEFNSAYFKGMGQNNPLNPKLAKYIAFTRIVETQFTEQPSISVIAKTLALTTSGLYSIVRTFSGVSPKAFIIRRLMLEAQRKLHYANPSVKELAYELGFSDPHYFSRIFKKTTGKSVGTYVAELADLSHT